MNLRLLVLVFLASCLACQGERTPQAIDTAIPDPESPVRIMIAENMKQQVAHWKLEGSMGIVVARKDQDLIDDDVKLKLDTVFRQIFEDYHLTSANLCKSEKPSPEWSDEEWAEFRGEPIDRLNVAIGIPVVSGIYCEGMVFAEYEPVFSEQP